MKKLIAIFHISMTAVLLFSTVGFSVSRHYCMGMLMDESFYSTSEACGMAADDDCGKPDQTFDMGCCDDENLIFSGIDITSTVKKYLDLTPLISSDLTQVFTLTRLHSTRYKLLSYFPPPEPLAYGRNLLVKVQRFLI